MKERGILFSAPMVLALLAGTKTQTRRAIKTHRSDDSFVCVDHGTGWWPYRSEDGESDVMSDGCEYPYICPYGVPGDRLWCRESWGYRCSAGTRESGKHLHVIEYRADGARQTFGPMPIDGVGLPKQRDVRDGETVEQRVEYLNRYWQRWRPSIHMPRWASRITLEITDVRVERLQDLSEADAKAEGCDPRTAGNSEHGPIKTYRTGYVHLWNEINGPGSWTDNPWVWAITFKRMP